MRDGGARLAVLEGEHTTLPSALFFDFETSETLFGRNAIETYVAGNDGRLMRSLKSALGSDLIDAETRLRKRRIRFTEAIAVLLSHLKRKAEAAIGRPIEAVVQGRPVHFVDGDPEGDRRAEAALGDALRQIGFRQVSFLYEPLGAALFYENQIAREEIALVADIGGGTSDFSLVRLSPQGRRSKDRTGDILANAGVRVGGTDFDRLLSLGTIMPLLGMHAPSKRTGLPPPIHMFHELATWATINFLYRTEILSALREIRGHSGDPSRIDRFLAVIRRRLGHALALAAEAAKIELSAAEGAVIDLGELEPGLTVAATQPLLRSAIAPSLDRLRHTVDVCLSLANWPRHRVDSLFLTGGSTLLPAVRRTLTAAVPEARAIEGDRFGAIGLGLALEAQRRYG
jgi:hypothetical chaperone protein